MHERVPVNLLTCLDIRDTNDWMIGEVIGQVRTTIDQWADL